MTRRKAETTKKPINYAYLSINRRDLLAFGQVMNIRTRLN